MFDSRIRVPIIAGVAMAGLLAACGGGPSRDPGGPLQVVAGFYPLAEAAAAVGGPDVTVTNLTPAGAEAHDLELSPSQVDLVLDADLVVLLGSGFQPALEAGVERREGPTLELLPEAEPGGTRSEEDEGPEEPHDEEGPEEEAHDDDEEKGDDDGKDEHGHDAGKGADPHVWLDPREFAEMAVEIGAALSDLRPEKAAAIRGRASEFAERLGDLHSEFERGLKDCERRTIVTTHAAFGHLAEAYDLQQEAISGLDPSAEPDPERLAELVDHLSESQATTVFVEPLASAAAAEVLTRETGVTTQQLDPLETLTAEKIDSGADYFSVMRANLAALRLGLGCK